MFMLFLFKYTEFIDNIFLLLVVLWLQPESANKWHKSRARHSAELQLLGKFKVKIGCVKKCLYITSSKVCN